MEGTPTEATFCIGIDIGGTSSKIGLVDQQGNLLARRSLDTQATSDAGSFTDLLASAIQDMINTHPAQGKILGIGIGAPGVDEHAGTIAAAANLPFKEPFALAALLEQKIGIRARLVKDSSAAILGERAFGGAKGMDHFILITLGTGLGSALMIHGKVITGSNGLASEYGHSPAVVDGRQCNCGRSGCLETYVSATGIKRTVFELMATLKIDSPLRQIPYNDLTARMIFDAAEAGDPLALEAFEQTGAILGRAITSLIVLLDPEAVFLAGGLIQAGHTLFDAVDRGIEKHLLNMFKGSCRVLPSSLGGEDTGILGAAAMMWQEGNQ